MLKKWWILFHNSLWSFLLKERGSCRFYFLKGGKIFLVSIRGFFKDRLTLYASALTFYTLMSIVPLLAIAFAMAKGLGIHENFQETLLSQFQEHETALKEIIQFAQKTLEQTKGSLLASFGILILFWSGASLLLNMEQSLNQIWQVEKMRSWKRILTDYFPLMLLGPLFYLICMSLTLYLVTKSAAFVSSLPLPSTGISFLLFFIRLAPYALFWALFTFTYFFIPNTKVRFRPALFSGLIAGSLYLAIQKFYIYFQAGATHYGAIYGSFAALPLFLIWVQLSWSILLFGGKVCYALQTLDLNEQKGG